MTIDIDELERIVKAGDRYGHNTPGVTLELIAEVRALRELCAATYQMAGVVNAPERFLDALSDAANGEIGLRASTDTLLPVDANECGAFPAESDDEVRALQAFHGFFRDRCEGLFGAFGMDAIDLYNAAAVAARKEQA